MAERVVHLLEVVQIEKQERHRFLVPARMRHGLARPLGEHRPVGKPGERVVIGHPLDALLVAAAVGDVADVGRVADRAADGGLRDGQLDRDLAAVGVREHGLDALADDRRGRRGHLALAEVAPRRDQRRRPAEHVGGGVAEHPLGGGVEADDHPGLVDGDEGVQRGVEHRGVALLALL